MLFFQSHIHCISKETFALLQNQVTTENWVQCFSNFSLKTYWFSLISWRHSKSARSHDSAMAELSRRLYVSHINNLSWIFLQSELSPLFLSLKALHLGLSKSKEAWITKYRPIWQIFPPGSFQRCFLVCICCWQFVVLRECARVGGRESLWGGKTMKWWRAWAILPVAVAAEAAYKGCSQLTILQLAMFSLAFQHYLHATRVQQTIVFLTILCFCR